MNLPRLAIVLIAILVLGEVGLALWRHLPVEPSTAPVFSFPPAMENLGKSGEMEREIEAFGCDRGSEWTSASSDGTQISLLYFEANAIQDRPLRDVALHKPESCNESLGYRLNKVFPDRTYQTSGHPPLAFDTTCFASPFGDKMYMFKLVWVQGRGSIEFRNPAGIRTERLKNAFIRNRRAARILQAGVFDARNIDHAWQVFRERVLDHLEWR